MKTIAFIGSFKTFQPGILDELDTVAAILEEELNRKVLYITVLGDVDQHVSTELGQQELDLVIVLGSGPQPDDELVSLIRRILKIEFGVTFESIFVESNKFLVETLLEPQLRSTSMEFYRLFKFAQFALEDLSKLAKFLKQNSNTDPTLFSGHEIAFQAIKEIAPILASTRLRRQATSKTVPLTQDHVVEVIRLIVEQAQKINFSFLSLFLLYYFNLYPDDLQTAVEISLEEGKVPFAQIRDELRLLQEEQLMKIQPNNVHIQASGRDVLSVLSLYITAYQNAWLESIRKTEMSSPLSVIYDSREKSKSKITLVGRDGTVSTFDVDKLLTTINYSGTSPTESLVITRQVLSFFKDSEILLSTYLISFIKFLLSHGSVDERGTHLIKALRYDYYTRPHHYLLVQVGPRKRRLTADLIHGLIKENWLQRLSFDASEELLIHFSHQLFEDIRDFFLSSLQVRNYVLEAPLEIPFLELQFMIHVKLLQMAPVLKNFPSPIQAPNPQLTYHENWKICRPYILEHAFRTLSLTPNTVACFKNGNIIEFYQQLFEIIDYFAQDVLLTFGYLPSNDVHRNLEQLTNLLSPDEEEKAKETILERLLHRCATITHESEAIAIINSLNSAVPRIQEYLTIITSYPFNIEWNDEIIKKNITIWTKEDQEQILQDLQNLLGEINNFYDVLLNVNRKIS